MEAHKLDNQHTRATFIFGGNAYFTLRSTKTGARFTYRARASKDGNVFFISVLRGADNEGDYTYMGVVRSDSRERFRTTAKSRVKADAPSAKALAWFLRNMASDAVECWHEGRCGCCGRKLTVPESIESGIGPECAKRTGRARKASSPTKGKKARDVDAEMKVAEAKADREQTAREERAKAEENSIDRMRELFSA